MKLASIECWLTIVIFVLVSSCGFTTDSENTSPDVSAPGGLTATATSDSTIQLTWMDAEVGEATGFAVERAMAETGPFTMVTTTLPSAMGYADIGLAASTTYFYRVRTTSSVGNSSYTTVVSAMTKAASAPPRAPTGLTATAMSSEAIELRWVDHADNESGFRVERATMQMGPFSEIAVTLANVTQYTDHGLTASTRYYYRARATNAAGNSSYTDVASAATQASPISPPAAPSNLSARAESASMIHLTWTDNSMNETGFKVERGASASGPFSQVTVTAANATSVDDIGLAAATTYYYRVRATNSAGDSAYSSVVSSTTQSNQICTPSQSQCVAGNITAVQTCNSSGTAWTTSTCPVLSLCSNNQCRVVCDMTSIPANPTLCVFPNQDSVNNGEWLYWTDSRLATPANTRGGSLLNRGGSAPVRSSGQTWPYSWQISTFDVAFTQFKLNQFPFPRSQRLTFRAKRAGVLTGAVNNFSVGVFDGRSTEISHCFFGPIPFTWTTTFCFNGPPLGSRLSYDGSWNAMLLSIAGDGFGGLIDLLDVNWVKLSIEP